MLFNLIAVRKKQGRSRASSVMFSCACMRSADTAACCGPGHAAQPRPDARGCMWHACRPVQELHAAIREAKALSASLCDPLTMEEKQALALAIQVDFLSSCSYDNSCRAILLLYGCYCSVRGRG
jgi:hypothetical protein